MRKPFMLACSLILTVIFFIILGRQAFGYQASFAVERLPEKRAEVVYQSNIVLLWNEVMSAAIRSSDLKPAVIARSMIMIHAAMYDASTAYDETARPTIPGYVARQPASEHTKVNKDAAISQAAYHTLVTLFPDYEKNTHAFTSLMHNLGYEIVNQGNPFTPAGIGYLAAQGVLSACQDGGSNVTSAHDPELHQPVYLAGSVPAIAPMYTGQQLKAWAEQACHSQE